MNAPLLQLAVAVAGSDAPPDAFVVWRGFEASMAKARRLGYDGVELALREAAQIDVRSVRKLLADQGLSCPCISTGQVFATLGLYFTCPDASRRQRALDVFRGLIDVAAQLGAMVNIGRVRGFVEPGQAKEEAAKRFSEAASFLAQYAKPQGVTLVLEPVNRYEINFVNSLAQGADLLARVGADNLRLMPDLFHMNIEDPSIDGELVRHASRIAYLHLADSNRLAPGQGHIRFHNVFAALKQSGYRGWASVEILPQPDADTAAGQAIEFLRPYLEAYNRA